MPPKVVPGLPPPPPSGPPPNRTIKSIIRNWFLDKVERNPGHFILSWLKFFFAILLVFVIQYPESFLLIIKKMLSIANYSLSWMLLFLVILYFIPFKTIGQKFKIKKKDPTTIYGFYPKDLVAFLWEYKKFNWSLVDENFQVSKTAWEKLSKELYANEILLKDLNNSNSFTVNPDMTKRDIAYKIHQIDKRLNELKPKFKRFARGNNMFSKVFHNLERLKDIHLFWKSKTDGSDKYRVYSEQTVDEYIKNEIGENPFTIRSIKK